MDPFASEVDTRNTQTSSNRGTLACGRKTPPPPPSPCHHHHHPYPRSHPRHGSLVYLSSSWGTDSLEWKGTEVPAATEITPNTGANVQDAGIKSSSGALFPPHFYLLALFWRAANWASALQPRCRSFKNISFHKSNSDVPKRAWGGGQKKWQKQMGALWRANLIVIAETEAAITRRADRESECNRETREEGANRVSGVISSLQRGRLLWEPLTCLFHPFVSVQTS